MRNVLHFHNLKYQNLFQTELNELDPCNFVMQHTLARTLVLFTDILQQHVFIIQFAQITILSSFKMYRQNQNGKTYHSYTYT